MGNVFKRADLEVDLYAYLRAVEPGCSKGDPLACYEVVKGHVRWLDAHVYGHERFERIARDALPALGWHFVFYKTLLRLSPDAYQGFNLYEAAQERCEDDGGGACQMVAQMKWLGYQTKRADTSAGVWEEIFPESPRAVRRRGRGNMLQPRQVRC